LARILGIDWDHDRFYLVSMKLGRGTAQVEQAIAWDEPSTQVPADLEAVGHRLKEKMKAANIAPALVLAGIGRDRVIIKDIRYPAVEPAQEPALIRFQAAKELTETPGKTTIDYTRFPEGLAASYAKNGKNGAGDRRAIVVAAKNDLIGSLHAVCRGAGLKLQAITPRAFGIAACLARLNGASGLAAPPPERGEVAAVLTASTRWAEFTVVRDGQVLFARPLPLGATMLGEVRRNLALFSSQMSLAQGGQAVQSLYFAGDNEHALAREQLQEALAVPVRTLDPFAREEQVGISGDRGGFTGIVGLGQLYSESNVLPINFVHPKEGKVENQSRSLPYLLAVGACLVVLMAVFVVGSVLAQNKKKELEAEEARLADMDKNIKKVQLELGQKLDKIDGWANSDQPWIDEFYNLTAHFPWEQGLKATQFSVVPVPSGSKFHAQMRLRGFAQQDLLMKRPNLLKEIVEALNSDPHYQASVGEEKPVTAKTKEETGRTFEIKIDMLKQAPDAFDMVLEVPQPAVQPARPFGKFPGR
jgi:Tfp pilus assembly PilM family ATPase